MRGRIFAVPQAEWKRPRNSIEKAGSASENKTPRPETAYERRETRKENRQLNHIQPRPDRYQWMITAYTAGAPVVCPFAKKSITVPTIPKGQSPNKSSVHRNQTEKAVLAIC